MCSACEIGGCHRHHPGSRKSLPIPGEEELSQDEDEARLGGRGGWGVGSSGVWAPLIRQLTSVPGPVTSWPACLSLPAAGLLDALLDGQSGERLSQTWS